MNGFALYLVTVNILTTSVLHVNGYEIRDVNEVSNERNLYDYLMFEYTPSVRPVRNDSDSIHLYVDVNLYMLEDLDEVNQALQASGWIYMSWDDFQLKWEPEMFGGVRETRIPINKLWSPDLAVYNSLDSDMLVPKTSHQLAIVYSSGTIWWVPAMKFRTFCPLDLTHFPFDEHLCSIHVGTWTHDEVEINMTTSSRKYEPTESSEWELVRTKFERNSRWYACCPNPFVDIKFQLLLRRRPTFASHLFIAPSVILCLITPSIFVLPPASFEKLTLGTGILIGYVLLLGELISFLPSAHPTVPLMGKFFLANIVMVSLSLVISVIALNLWSRSKTRCVGPPNFCRTILLHWLVTKILLIDLYDYDDEDVRGPSTSSAGPGGEQAGTLEVMTDIAVSDGSGNSATTDDRVRILDQAARLSAKSDWRRLAVVIDRFFFALFAIILIITCLAFAGYL